MFVYVEWSYSANSPNKIIIHSIKQDKSHPSNKYTISKEKFLLHEEIVYPKALNVTFCYNLL